MCHTFAKAVCQDEREGFQQGPSVFFFIYVGGFFCSKCWDLRAAITEDSTTWVLVGIVDIFISLEISSKWLMNKKEKIRGSAQNLTTRPAAAIINCET